MITAKQTFFSVWVDIIPEDIRFLVGLDILDHYSLQVLSVSNELTAIRSKFNQIYDSEW